MEERLMTYAVIIQLTGDANVSLLAVEEDADQRRLGVVDVVLESIGCCVDEAPRHPAGAVGIIRQYLDEAVAAEQRPSRL